MATAAVLLLALVLPAAATRAVDAYCQGLSLPSLPSADVAACGLAENELWGFNSNLYTDKKCTNAACQRLVAAADAANPSECLVGTGHRVGLRATVLEPLAAKCAALAQASVAPSPTAPTTTPTTLAPPPPTTTATTTTAAPTTTEVAPSTLPPTTTVPPPTVPSVTTSTPAPTNTSGVIDTAPEEQAPASTDVGATTASKASTSSVTWILPTIIAIVGVVLAILIAMFIRRRRRGRAAQPHTTTTASGTAPSTGTTGFGTSTRSDDLIPQAHHLEMDAMLREDTKLTAWRLFAKQIHDKKFLGKGSHAFVHLVQLPNGTLLASKRLARDQATPKHLKQLLAEVHIVAPLQHASIVQFKGVIWTNAMDFQVLFEYMRGGDLRQYLDKQNRASFISRSAWTGLKLQMALSIAEGLAYAHSFTSPLVHRDLKSRNILLTEDLRAKISDFGVSRFQSENDTMTTGVGTNRWLAPEVLVGGGAYNEKCDIYSFGVVMTELDTHQVPLEKEIAALRSSTIGESRNRSELWVLREIANGTLQPSMSSSGPPEVRKLVMRCLSHDPSSRPDALELSYRLRKLVSGKCSDGFS